MPDDQIWIAFIEDAEYMEMNILNYDLDTSQNTDNLKKIIRVGILFMKKRERW